MDIMGNIENVNVYENTFAHLYSTGNTPITFLKPVLKNSDKLGYPSIADIGNHFQIYNKPSGADVRLIDGTYAEPIRIEWQGTNYNQVIISFSFNLQVVDNLDTNIANCRVYLKNTQGNEVLNTLTDINGIIPEQIIDKEYYEQVTGDTPTTRNPYTYKLRKYGYIFFESIKSFSNPVNEKTTLLKNNYVVTDENTVSLYTGITIDGITKKITISGTRTIQELYDYTQWWASQASNIQYD